MPEQTTLTSVSLETRRVAFYERARTQDLSPLWLALKNLVPAEPSSPALPQHWRYADVRPFLLESAELIGAAEAERRVLMLENPGLRGEAKITRSLYAGLQLVMPGEVAHANRHTASALRFVLESDRGYTSVDGERTYMAPGDFVITPSWTWHDHGNEGDQPVIWMDGLDLHFVNLMDCGFREDGEELVQATPRPVGSSTAEAALNLLPLDYETRTTTSPIFNYPYVRTREALAGVAKLRPPEPGSGYRMRYANPVNGGWAIPTIATWAQLLPKGFVTQPHRSTDGTVMVVVEGKGWSLIDGERYDWGPNDILVAPSWRTVVHHPEEEAVFFCWSDRSVQEAFGFWREQTLPQ
jgi:gentisate 1,2-dioxygenase